MNFEYYIEEANNLEKYVVDSQQKDWVGALGNISARYNTLIKSVPYSWFFCEGLMYNDIDEKVKGNSMEFDALIHNLRSLKVKLKSYKKYSNIHINTEFTQLKKCIINEIKKAQISIFIAVAWLSDDDICRELMIASGKGLDIRILMIDCESNRNSILNTQENNLELIFVEEFGRYNQNKMHNKFSVFDSNTVITGSYNWSNNANYNNENIVLIVNDDIARTFTLEFIKLIKQHR